MVINLQTFYCSFGGVLSIFLLNLISSRIFGNDYSKSSRENESFSISLTLTHSIEFLSNFAAAATATFPNSLLFYLLSAYLFIFYFDCLLINYFGINMQFLLRQENSLIGLFVGSGGGGWIGGNSEIFSTYHPFVVPQYLPPGIVLEYSRKNGSF